jgi:tetratricopeptide (TPR) repeat protein
MTAGWGTNTAYYNPYYAEPAVAQSMPYDYSQPVVINNYTTSSAEGGAAEGEVAQAEPSPQQQQALSAFDDGLAKFKTGDYVQALSLFNSALKQMPNDPVVHEVRSLALFATGDFNAAAAGLNSLLSAAPGMDWTTMSGLYGNADDYTAQLRKLEQFAKANPNDASAHFVLAYHYMVLGEKDAAIDALRVVVKNQPKDVTARRMLDAMAPAQTPSETAAAPTPAPAAADAPKTDLVGSWMAQAGNTKITLAIGEDSQFVWNANTEGQDAVELKGDLNVLDDGIVLETADQGAMAGKVQSKNPDQWVFSIKGAPASDPGLSFARVK